MIWAAPCQRNWCLHESKDDVFAYYQLNEQIAGISDRKVWLDCGGYLVIDYTEAMTVIDVNSGKFQRQC